MSNGEFFIYIRLPVHLLKLPNVFWWEKGGHRVRREGEFTLQLKGNINRFLLNESKKLLYRPIKSVWSHNICFSIHIYTQKLHRSHGYHPNNWWLEPNPEGRGDSGHDINTADIHSSLLGHKSSDYQMFFSVKWWCFDVRYTPMFSLNEAI